MKVWICSRDFGYDGWSPPEHVFDSKEKADKWAAAETGHSYYDPDITELEIE